MLQQVTAAEVQPRLPAQVNSAVSLDKNNFFKKLHQIIYDMVADTQFHKFHGGRSREFYMCSS